MANDFLDLPLPVLNGPGAAVDVSGLGTPKTIEVVGDFPGATIAVEISEDGGTTFAPLVVFQNGGGQRTVVVVASHMRVRVSGRKASIPFTANADVGAPAATPLFANIPLPAGNGPGTPVDISDFGDIVTLVVGGSFPGAVVAIEISEDGNTYAPLVSFSGVGGYFTASTTALWIRTNVKGRKAAVPFSAQVDLGAVPITGDAITGITVQDEGVDLAGNPFHIFDFEGAGVIATNQGGGKVRITIPGGGGIAGINVFDSGAPLVGNPYTDINFTDGLVASDVAGVATVSAPGLAGHTPGAVLFAGPGGLPDEDPTKFFYDLATGRLGVGNAAPTTTVDVTGTTRTTNLAITALTLGSLLFAGAGGAVTQDNPNLFYDVATHRLGLGTTTPATPLDIAGVGTAQSFNVANAGSAFYASADGASAAVAAANTGRLRYNNSTKKWQLSVDTGAYVDIVSGTGAGMAIGNTVTGGTTGSALFIGAGPVLAQDNANFFWDVATHRLGIGNAAPTTPLDVTGVARATNVTISAMTLGSALFAGASGAVTQDNANYFYDATNHRLGLGNAAPTTTLDVTGIGTAQSFNVANAGSAFYSSADGASAAVSAANTGRLRYNNTAKKWQVSVDTGAYADIATGTAGMAIGGTVTSGTTGSALFVGAGPVLAQDNANYFYDSTNHRLGLGLTGPASRLDILETVNQTALITLENTSTGSAGGAGIAFKRNDGNLVGTFGFANGGFSTPSELATSMFLRMDNTGLASQFRIGNTSRTCFGFAADTGRMNVIGGSVSSPGFPQYVNVYHNTNDASTAGVFVQNQNGSGLSGITAAGSNGSGIAFFGAHTSSASTVFQVQIRNTNTIPALIHGTNNTDIVFIVNNQNDTGYSGMGFGNSNNVPVTATVGSIGYGRANVGITGFRDKNFWFSGGNDWVIGNASTVQIQIGATTGSAFLAFADGASAAVSAASTGRLRYNNTTKTFQVSADTGAYVSIGTLAAAFTTGSVIFANSSGQLAQDNSTFFYDSTNHRLGLGTTSPQNLLHLQSGSDTIQRMRSTLSTGFSYFSFYDDTNTLVANLGYGNTATTDPKFTSTAFWKSTGSNIAFIGTEIIGSAAFLFRMQDTETSLQMRAGDSSTVSSANTAKLRYNAGTDKLQVSKNGAAFIDIV